MNLATMAQWAALTPRNLGVALISAYRYHPSCSAYGLGQVQQRGLVVGSFLALWRILRCNPFSHGGVDNVRLRNTWFQINRFGFAEPKLVKGI